MNTVATTMRTTRRGIRRRTWPITAVVVGLMMVGGTGRAVAAWRPVAAPTVGLGIAFAGVSASSTNHAWAVGAYRNAYGVERATILRWDGTAWDRAGAVNPGDPRTRANVLYAVRAVSNTNVWAVGATRSTDGRSGQPLIEHWNGVAWRIVPGVRVSGVGVLRAVCRVAGTSRMWAVGGVTNPGTGDVTSLLERWNGHAWRQSRPPYAGFMLTGCVARPYSMWTVGTGDSAVAWHWYGKWSGRSFESGTGMWAIASTTSHLTHMWAVGNANSATSSPNTPTAWHWTGRWNGQEWWPVPDSSVPLGYLSGVTARPDNVWAVGTTLDSTPLIAQWNGTAWTAIPGLPTNAGLQAIARVPYTNALWTVGYTNGDPSNPFPPLTGARPLILTGP